MPTTETNATPLQRLMNEDARVRHDRLFNAPAPTAKPQRTRPVSPFNVSRVLAEAVERHKPRNPLFPVAIIELDDNGQPLRPSVFAAQWRAISLEVAAKHGVSIIDLQSQRRDKTIVAARHECFYRCRLETGLSLPQIGHRFGGRDHTTVLHGIRKHAERTGAPLPA